MDKLSVLDTYLHEKRWRKAIKIAEGILNSSAPDIFSSRRCLSFMSGEAYTFYCVTHPDEDVVWLRNYASVMFSKAYALSELKEYDTAVDVLKAALKIDPVSAKIRFELCSNYIKLGQFETAANELRAAKPNIMSLHEAAMLYRKSGFLESQSKMYEHARLLTLYSLLFEWHDAALKELRYIDGMTGDITPDDKGLYECALDAAKQLSDKGDDFTLNPDVRTALERLRALYVAGCDEQKADNLTQQLDAFDEICER